MNNWQTVTTQGTQLKREQLYKEICKIKEEPLKSNLLHTYSKLFMFLEEDLGIALKIAANNPYIRKDNARKN